MHFMARRFQPLSGGMANASIALCQRLHYNLGSHRPIQTLSRKNHVHYYH